MISRSKFSSSRKRFRSGGGFAVLVMLTVVALMTINAFIATHFFRATMDGVDSRIVDPLKFISTVLLVFLEYWLYDQFMKWLPQKRAK